MENRLKTMVILFVLIFCVYTTQFFVLSGIDSLESPGEYEDIGGFSANSSRSQTEIELEKSTNIFSIIGGMFEFLTFQGFVESGMNVYALLLINFVMLIVGIIVIYILASIIYDFVKALPFT